MKVVAVIILIAVILTGLFVWHRHQLSLGKAFFGNGQTTNTGPGPQAPTTYTQLPLLKTAGSQIVNAVTNQPIVLKGFVTIVNIYAYNDDSFQDYTATDYQTMKSYGANYQSIRLGGKAIGGAGASADETYLKRIDGMVANASENGIYSNFKLTVFDMPGFSGAGKAKAWGDFWRNTNGQQETLIAGWKNIWTRYKDNTSVVGYDLLNEPNQGDLGVSQIQFVTNYLGPFYQKAIDQMRTIDQQHIAYFQPGLNNFDDIPFSFTINRPNIIYAPHFYPGIVSYLQGLYSGNLSASSITPTYNPLMQQFLSDASRNNAPLLFGEYGMPWDPKFDGDAQREGAFTTLENAALDLMAQNHASYSRPWYGDDNTQVSLPKVVLGWALIKGTTGLSGQPRDIILTPFKNHAQ